MEFLVDNWLDDLWLVMKIVIVVAIALVFILNRIDRQETYMTKIEVYDEDAAELIRMSSRLGTTIAEVISVLLEVHGSDVMTEYEKVEE